MSGNRPTSRRIALFLGVGRSWMRFRQTRSSRSFVVGGLPLPRLIIRCILVSIICAIPLAPEVVAAADPPSLWKRVEPGMNEHQVYQLLGRPFLGLELKIAVWLHVISNDDWQTLTVFFDEKHRVTETDLVIGPVSAAKVAEQELTNYRIQSVEIPIPPAIKELYGWMHEFHLFRNVLRFRWSELDIDVARSATMRPFADRGFEQLGFDSASLKIQWLDPGRLIWMKWGTFPQGSGRYSKQGHLVLQLNGGSFKELFRDSIYAHGSAGLLSSSSVGLDIRYDSSLAELAIVQTEVDLSSWDKKPDPEPITMHVWATDEGNTIYWSETRTQTLWRYRIENGQLRFLTGERSAELPKECTILEVAEAFRTSAAKLRRLNPKLEGTDRASGTLILEDGIGPYAHENDDGICGDKPCPNE